MNKLQRNFLQTSLDLLTDGDLEDLATYIHYCLKYECDIDYLAESYDFVVKEVLREQIYFKRHKRYRHSRFDEVSASVYNNRDYMSKYMLGLALTTFLWPNHLALKQFFVQTLPRDMSGIYLEIGPGHGIYFIKAIQNIKFSRVIGVDISSTSVNLTKRILETRFLEHFSEYEIIECNFLNWDTTMKYDAVIAGEVLEHTENPLDLLQKINELATESTYIFITTCVNSPALDHIYLYRSIDEIENQITTAGLQVRKSLIVPYSEMSLEECAKQELPVNIAMVLGKQL
jgi:2-polyprenyl-3-methyl-5-hydroxy-6-metoxy-1,4-benzoquinol methylase